MLRASRLHCKIVDNAARRAYNKGRIFHPVEEEEYADVAARESRPIGWKVAREGRTRKVASEGRGSKELSMSLRGRARYSAKRRRFWRREIRWYHAGYCVLWGTCGLRFYITGRFVDAKKGLNLSFLAGVEGSVPGVPFCVLRRNGREFSGEYGSGHLRDARRRAAHLRRGQALPEGEGYPAGQAHRRRACRHRCADGVFGVNIALSVCFADTSPRGRSKKGARALVLPLGELTPKAAERALSNR